MKWEYPEVGVVIELQKDEAEAQLKLYNDSMSCWVKIRRHITLNVKTGNREVPLSRTFTIEIDIDELERASKEVEAFLSRPVGELFKDTLFTRMQNLNQLIAAIKNILGRKINIEYKYEYDC